MNRFARETGLHSESKPDRYLWTDAFAVGNYLGLYQSTKMQIYLDCALQLVNQVHQTLGKYRTDDHRSGWLGSEDQPTSAGLRIGKPFPERSASEKIDRVKEWQRDGQYFHYLTKWMYALIRVFEVTDDRKYLGYSTDLAKASMAFVDGSKMYWKMSTDLSYPLIDSMGKHDPLDGYITFLEINNYLDSGELEDHANKMGQMVQQVDTRTTDPLGLGGLLFDYYRLSRHDSDHELLESLEVGINWGLERVVLDHHLAFRELGLSFGLHTADLTGKFSSFAHLRDDIHEYWANRNNFEEHRQINTVMLVSSYHPLGMYRD